MTRVEELIRAARHEVVRKQPYLAAAAYSIKIVRKEVPGDFLAGMDKTGTLYLNEPEMEKLDPVYYPAIFLHELKRFLSRHFERMEHLGATDPVRWNVATELEINQRIKDFPLPDGALLPRPLGLPEDLIAEEYYKLLGERQEQQNPEGHGSQQNEEDKTPEQRGQNDREQPKQSKRNGAAASSRAGGNEESGGQAGSGGGVEEGYQNPGGALSGSAADNIRRPWEDTPNMGDVEAKAVIKQVVEAYKQARLRGHGDGFMDRLVEYHERPFVNWRKALSGAIRGAVDSQSAAVDYSYRRPSRRYEEFVAPRPEGRKPKVAVIVDTSGSMLNRDLSVALAEVEGIIRQLGDRIEWYSADYGVNNRGIATRARHIKLKGGGGTNMARAIEEVAKSRKRPEVIVVLTDGETPWPDRPPKGIKVVAGIINNDPYDIPPWVRVVKIDKRGR